MNAKELLDHRNMMIAVKKGVVPREEFRKALNEQRHLFSKTKSFTPLSQILVERGIVSLSQIEKTLSPIVEKNFACPLPEKNQNKKNNDNAACLVKQSEKGLSLIATKDGLTAFLSATGNESDFPTLEDVHQLLNSNGIVFGVIDDQKLESNLKNALDEKSAFVIATGLAPEQGEPDRVTYHFDTNPFRVGTVKDDGLMDWKERGEYPFVEKDTVLATITPGKKSIPGKNIFGYEIPANEVPRLHLFAGKGVTKSKDRLQLIAKVSGQPQLAGRGNVAVLQTLEIKGDIGIETGHVEFEGHIEVRGAVQKGYRAKADSLRAKEILSEQVEIAGDVIAMRGIFGANIRCDGRIKANHINKSTIMAEGDVVVAKEVVECKIITNGKCILDGGTILSSLIYAKKGLKAGAVGSEVANPSKLIVGIDQIAVIKVNEYKKEIVENTDKIVAMEEKISALNAESDEINTKLGEIAQIQDNYMLDKRKLTDLIDKKNRSLSVEEQKTISELDEKIVEIDKTVEELMARDEKAQAEVDLSRNQIIELKHRNNVLTEEIKETELKAKQDMGIPVIQISGKLYQNTDIEGPHDNLIIEKTLKNANIKEQKNPEKDAEKKYFFKVT
ncbi:MAG: FapA family protein, partial [Desulfobacteraceae bacterium]